MTRKSADTQRRHDELASDLRHLAEEIRPLTDSVDGLYVLLQHMWQNREELFELLNSCSDHVKRHSSSNAEALPPETLFCTSCDASTMSLAVALRAGWQCIIDDEGNDRGNYAGTCPACMEDEENVAESVRELSSEQGSTVEKPVGQKRLF